MSIWIGLSVLAISIKLWLFSAKSTELRGNTALKMMLLGFLGMNIIELIGFYALKYDVFLLPLLSLYYLFATIMAASMLNVFMQMNGASSTNLAFNWGTSAIMGGAFLIPGVMLAGVEHLGVSGTRIAGPYYNYWIVYISSVLVFAMVQLVSFYVKHRKDEEGKKVVVILLGLTPFILTSIGVMTAMQMGYRVNGGVILSLMVCTFLICLVWAESKHSIFKVLSRVPNTEEHRIRTQLQSAFASIEMNAYSGGEIGDGLASSLRELEKSYKQLTGEVSRHGSLIRAEASSRDQSSGGWMMY